MIEKCNQAALREVFGFSAIDAEKPNTSFNSPTEK